MNAPDKIYLEKDKETEKIDFRWRDHPVVHSAYEHIEYIRKDVSNEAIQVAEDHAYFAGQEKFREELLAWAKERLTYYQKLEEGDLVRWGQRDAFLQVIDKIKSL